MVGNHDRVVGTGPVLSAMGHIKHGRGKPRPYASIILRVKNAYHVLLRAKLLRPLTLLYCHSVRGLHRTQTHHRVGDGKRGMLA